MFVNLYPRGGYLINEDAKLLDLYYDLLNCIMLLPINNSYLTKHDFSILATFSLTTVEPKPN